MHVGRDTEHGEFSPSGVRLLPIDEARRVGTMAGGLYLACGVSVVQIAVFATDDVRRPGPYLAAGIVVTLAGALVIGLSRVADAPTYRRLYPWMVNTLLWSSVAAIPLILHLVGFDRFATGSAVYALPLTLAAYVVRPVLSGAVLAACGLGHGVLLATSDEVVSPVMQWTFLMTVLTATTILVGGLVQRLEQSGRAEQRARALLAESNVQLEQTVTEQVDQLERLSRLRRFLSAQVADAVVSSGDDTFLEAHRCEISVLFCDLRGFTGFASQVEPEEVMDVLEAYYQAVGEQILKYDATVGTFAGDGIMAYFNDPNPCDRPASQAVNLALGLLAAIDELADDWTRSGYSLGCGVGVAMGHATLGVVGFEGRHDYTALGTVVNRASRLCDEARAGEVLVDRRVALLLGDEHPVRPPRDLTLKGFTEPVSAFAIDRR